MDTTAYTALCERAGRWWTIRIPQVDGLTAQARTLDQAEMMARQTVARALGVAPESITVDVVPEAPAPVTEALQARHAAREALEMAVQATLTALETLAQEGYQFVDAAAMLGLSQAEITQYSPDRAAASASGPIHVPVV
jgi:predicted RNase H-like HicB family nuclease